MKDFGVLPPPSCNAGRPPEPPASTSQMLAHPALGFLAGRFVLATQDTGAFIPHLSCRFFYTRQSLPPLHNIPFRDYKQSPHSWTFENELSTQEGGSLWRPAVSTPPPPRPAKGFGRQKFKAHLVECFCLREGPREAMVLRGDGAEKAGGDIPTQTLSCP